MPQNRKPLSGIPTNIVTGFLGAGKTSAILNFLAQKPAGERWAVLINEFGEIGVDGSLLEGRGSEPADVFVAEVPGGCMCCTAGLPMQIALTQLLRRSRPQRLLIEPTGLGHPIEVLQTLASEHYRDVLSLQKTLTLVDARNLADSRYTSNDTFLQQLNIADLVVGNKEDLYEQRDRDALRELVKQHGNDNVELLTCSHGRLDLSCLEGSTAQRFEPRSSHGHAGKPGPTVAERPLPERGVLRAENAGEGFQSLGWRFSPDRVFDRERVINFLRELDVERVKAVFITQAGIFGYNGTRDGVSETELDDCIESRIEIIAQALEADLEQRLYACLHTAPEGTGSKV
ncbi:MAG: CobW family GTP-binding protein [Pseudomonadota bacterium]